MINKTVQVTSHAINSTPAAGILVIQEFSKAERIARTARNTTCALIATGIALFIPIAHFILVPLGFVITIATFSRSLATRQKILSGEANCPCCGKILKIFPRRFRLPFKDTCEHCHREITIGS